MSAVETVQLACVLTVTLWTQVPDAIKSQYQNPPSTLLPARVRQLELVCSGVPNRQPSKHLTTEAEQQEVGRKRIRLKAFTEVLTCWCQIKVPCGGGSCIKGSAC